MLKMRVGGKGVIVVAHKKDHSCGKRKFQQHETDMQIIREEHRGTLSRNKWDEEVPKSSEECRVVSGVVHHDRYVQEAAMEKLLRIVRENTDKFPDEMHKEADEVIIPLLTALGLRQIADIFGSISERHWKGHILEREILCG